MIGVTQKTEIKFLEDLFTLVKSDSSITVDYFHPNSQFPIIECLTPYSHIDNN